MPLIFPPTRVGLSRIAVFHGLSPQELAAIEPLVSPVSIPKDKPLLQEEQISDGVYFILSGTVCICRVQRGGALLILNMVGAGEMLGEVCATDNQGHSATALATEPTAVLRMRREEFIALEESLPRLSKSIKHLLARRLRFATLHNETLAAREVHLRVARLFCALADRYGEDRTLLEVPIPLRLTKTEIAEWACVSRRHIGIHLSQLCDAGLLQKNPSHRFVVLDRARLREHCG